MVFFPPFVSGPGGSPGIGAQTESASPQGSGEIAGVQVAPAPAVAPPAAQPAPAVAQPAAPVAQPAPVVAPEVEAVQEVDEAPAPIAEATSPQEIAAAQIPVPVRTLPSTGGSNATPAIIGLSALILAGFWLRARGRQSQKES